MNEFSISHDRDAGQFHAQIEGQRCVADYRLAGQVMHIVHTGVPRPLRGRGIAGRLVDAALNEARASGWRVNPVCSYVAVYMHRHPETRDLLEAR